MLNRVLRYFSPSDRKFAARLKNLLGFRPSNISLYHMAFRHRSSTKAHDRSRSNERLEYLGDAILGAIVAEVLFKKYPYKDEGFLTEMRSKIVNRENLNRLALKLGIRDLIETSEDNNPKNKSILGDAFEALIGAIYLDQGYLKTKRVIIGRILKHHINIDELQATETNYKSRLIEWVQREKKTMNFEVMEEIGEGRSKMLKIRVMINGEPFGEGMDFSKKKAEQIAAEKTCLSLGI